MLLGQQIEVFTDHKNPMCVNRGDIVRPWMTTAPAVNAVF